ncbi:FAD-dependent oxidoreductase [Deinococcus altitudinis]|uniref:FAD-dependent oxidoreductase n=1 Tax=Deinococcus altitudinis TaxID=468914 RepID=UPI003891AC3A
MSTPIFPAEQPGPRRRMLVIGGGIAGASVAYFASAAGWNVTVLDAGHTHEVAGPVSGSGRASDVPSALLNPVRGQSGQVDARDLKGLRLSWSLIRHLSGRGHQIPHEQSGVLRPLATDVARAKFERHLPADLPRRWLSPTELLSSGAAPAWPVRDWLAPGWPHLLFLPEGGWVSGPALVAALLAESGANIRRARALTWNAGHATLESGETLTAEVVVWCGGSVGAGWGGGSGQFGAGQFGGGLDAQTFTHRRGSLLLLERSPAPLPVSAGVYLAPHASADGSRGGVLGATFEAPSAQAHVGGLPLKSLHWLLSRAAALTGDLSPAVTGIWTGSRLSGESCGRQSGGWWALAGLGSKGFLLGPLLARQLVSDLEVGSARTGLSD